jgi:putative ABC transport system permease protein
MFTHYLSTALRHFRRHTLTTAINVASLALGLICFITAFAFTQYLRESDRHQRNADRLYAITERIYVPGTEVSYPTLTYAAWPTANYLKTDFPQLEAVVRASTSGEVPVASGARKAFMQVTYADPGFFDIFDFTFLKGGTTDPLIERRSAVVSEAFAVRMFGTTDVIGRPLLIRDAETVFIRAVIGAVPRPSHMSPRASLHHFSSRR